MGLRPVIQAKPKMWVSPMPHVYAVGATDLHAVEDVVLPALALQQDAKSLIAGARLHQLQHLLVLHGEPVRVSRPREREHPGPQTDGDGA